MDTVPENVAEIIERKADELEDARQKKEQEEANQQVMNISKGRELLRARIAEILEEVPEWIRGYDITERLLVDQELEGIGQGVGLNNLFLIFEIPGLAHISFVNGRRLWRYASSAWGEWDDNPPECDFRANSWSSDLELVLLGARESALDFENKKAIYTGRIAQRQAQAAAYERRDQEREEKAWISSEEKRSEETQLVEALKSDPVAILLVKALLMVHEERSSFEERINEADATLYSVEDRWSRKASDLRSQAAEADRRAEDERRKARDLEDDLSNANKKLDKVKRGW